MWCLLVIAGVPRHPHHPQVGPAKLGQSLGGVHLLGLLPFDQVRRSEAHTHTHTHTHRVTWAQVNLSEGH